MPAGSHPMQNSTRLVRAAFAQCVFKAKVWLAYCVMVGSITLAACGGGSSSDSCTSQGTLPVSSFSYPGAAPFLIGGTVDLAPAIQTTSGAGVANLPLRFELASGSLPIGLTLNAGNGRITGAVQGPIGNYPLVIRLTAACYAGEATRGENFTVM